MPGHAYTVIAAHRIERGKHKGARLLKMRNPWGNFEWDGAWGDNSPEMNDPEVRDELEVELAADDGTFWMSFDDFLSHFVAISVCFPHVPGTGVNRPPAVWPDSIPAPHHADRGVATAGTVVRRKACFAPATGADGKPSGLQAEQWFTLRVDAPAGGSEDERVTCMIGLHQIDERVPSAPHYIDCGLAVLEDVGGDLIPVSSVIGLSHEPEQERPCSVGAAVVRDQLLVAQLLPGEYVVVPTTSGREPCAPHDAPPDAPPTQLLDESWDGLVPAARHALEHACFTLDVDMDGVLGADDLSHPAAAPFVAAASIDVSEDGSGVGRVKLAAYGGFIAPSALRRALAEAWGSERAPYDSLLRAVGYDGALRPSAVRHPFVLSVHSTGQAAISPRPFEPAQHEQLQCEIIKANGKKLVVGKVEVFTLHSSGGVSFCACNTDRERSAELTVDCTGSTNVRSSTGELAATVKLAAQGPSRLALILMPLDRFEAWGYSFKVSCYFAKVRPVKAAA